MTRNDRLAIFLTVIIILCLCIISLFTVYGHQAQKSMHGYEWLTPELYGTIKESSEKYGHDQALICALIHVESRGRNIVSRVNRNGTRDYGLCQINSVHRPHDPGAFLDPAVNIEMGCKFLRYCRDRGGNIYEAVRMYNAGPNSKVTHNHIYVVRVLDNYRER